MTQVMSKDDIPRQQMRAIRQARRYLKNNEGALARVLNAYKSAQQNGAQRGYLSER